MQTNRNAGDEKDSGDHVLRCTQKRGAQVQPDSSVSVAVLRVAHLPVLVGSRLSKTGRGPLLDFLLLPKGLSRCRTCKPGLNPFSERNYPT